MKISGRIKALIVMAIVIYVVGHVVRAMVMMLMHPGTLLPASRRTARLERDADRALKHCTRC